MIFDRFIPGETPVPRHPIRQADNTCGHCTTAPGDRTCCSSHGKLLWCGWCPPGECDGETCTDPNEAGPR